MSLGKYSCTLLLLLAALAFSGCSGGGSSSTSGTNALSSIVQDLDQDAGGTVTVLQFESATGLADATTANFSASGGQTPSSVVVNDDTVTITWSSHVSPQHTVSVTGLSGVSGTSVAVTTSDASAPTFTVEGEQNAGWGNDTLTVQFDGIYVSESTAENTANWVLTVNGSPISLSGTTFDFDAGTQSMTMDLGNTAALWSSFTLRANGVRGVNHTAISSTNIAGTATGDNTAPTLVAARQRLDADEFGRVVEFQFSEAMSPNFSTQLSRFGTDLPNVAVSVDQDFALFLTVTFNNPMVPGVDEVELLGLVDMHGNALADQTTPIAQYLPVANAVDGTPTANTVANEGGDYIVFTTTQAFDPDSANDVANWDLVVDGNTIDLTTQTLEYDLETKTTTITLDFDMQNGDSFTLTASDVMDVDGDLSALTTTQTVGGDTTEPTVASTVQNRSFDSTGVTVDVTFSEDVEEASAENLANYAVSGGSQTLVSATLQLSGNVVSLEFDAPMVPGLHAVVVSGVQDLAGNTMAAPSATSLTSTDTTAPTISTSSANAVAGLANDTLVVTFSDDMYASSVEDSSNWVLESPIGSTRTLGVCSVSYNSVQRRATLTLDGSTVNLQQGADYQISFSGGVDLGGNTLSTTPSTGNVNAEFSLPEATLAFTTANPNEAVVVFSEPCGNLDDLYSSPLNLGGVQYVLRDNTSLIKGSPLTATMSADGLSVSLSFGVPVLGTDTLDVIGARDAAGNPMFPELAMSLGTEDSNEPALSSSVAVAVSGEENDTLTLVFDRPMNPWGLTDRNNYTIDTGVGSVGTFRLGFAFNGTDTLTITLLDDGTHNLQFGDTVTLSAENLFSACGVPMTLATGATPVVGGDNTPPTVAVGAAKLDPVVTDSVLVEFGEAVDPDSATDASNYLLQGAIVATSCTQLSPRVVRVTFPSTPLVGDTLDCTVKDLAGNTGVISSTIATDDTAHPLVVSVSGTAVEGYGSDTVEIVYDEPVTQSAALLPANYSITCNGSPISLSGATVRYFSSSNTVRFTLASGQELVDGGTLAISVSNITDHSGNSLSTSTNGLVSGDATGPASQSSFVNWSFDFTGATVDVLFNEDVQQTAAENETNWSTSGSATVLFVERVSARHYRVMLSAALGSSETLSANNMLDAAGNAAAGALSSNPVE